jgi:hypothetical protein
LLPTHYGPAAQKTQSWQASWYFFKVVKLQQGVALYDYQHGSKLGDFFCDDGLLQNSMSYLSGFCN